MKLKRFAARTLSAAALTLAALAPAAARDANALAQACRDDHGKFCASVRLGGGRIADCLKQHEADLAPACRKVLGTIVACSNEARQICGADAEANALRECARARSREFSETCRAALAN